MNNSYLNCPPTEADVNYFKEYGFLLLKNFYTNEEKNKVAIQLAKIAYQFSRKINLNPLIIDPNFDSKDDASSILDELVCSLEQINPDLLFNLN